MSDADWPMIHNEVQQILAALDPLVEADVPGVRIDAGRTAGRGFFLFSYRRFVPPGESRIDPVVAGLLFEPADDGVAITADLSGEETGDVFGTLATTLIRPTAADLLHHARGFARIFARGSRQISAALQDHSRQID